MPPRIILGGGELRIISEEVILPVFRQSPEHTLGAPRHQYQGDTYLVV